MHLIKPLGFSIEDRYLKRAGLDYWKYLDLKVHESWDDFLESWPDNQRLWLVSTKGAEHYHKVGFNDGDGFVFGQETAGLPDSLHACYPSLRIPMGLNIRSLNLSNSVALVLYEALRQLEFPELA